MKCSYIAVITIQTFKYQNANYKSNVFNARLFMKSIKKCQEKFEKIFKYKRLNCILRPWQQSIRNNDYSYHQTFIFRSQMRQLQNARYVYVS
eukprot:403359262